MKLHELEAEVEEEEEFEEGGDEVIAADLSIALGLLADTNEILFTLLDQRLYPRLNAALSTFQKGEVKRLGQEVTAFLSQYENEGKEVGVNAEMDPDNWEGYVG